MLTFALRDFLTMILIMAVLIFTTEISVLPSMDSNSMEDDDTPRQEYDATLPPQRHVTFLDSRSMMAKEDTPRQEYEATLPLPPQPPPRNVTFLDSRSMMDKKHIHDSYSGMWWVKRDVFEKKWARPQWEMATQASFKLFYEVGMKNVLLTKDWLDFNVEHLSHYFKYMTMTNSVFARHADKQVRYMKEASSSLPPQGSRKSGFATTLAILPHYQGDKNRTKDASQHYTNLQEVPQKKRKEYLYMLSIASTLVSLHKVGIPRAIITGNTMEEPPEIHEAIEIAREYIKERMSVSYVPIFEKDMYELHTPTKALDLLQAALNNTMPSDRRKQWLGDNPDAIEYIYFSEPDLILHAREHDQLVAALDQGKLMAAHRFQILPHQIDFPTNEHPKELLPNMNNLSVFVDLDTDQDACCDAGNYWPGLDKHAMCHIGGEVWWYRCGHITAKPKMTTDEFYEQHFRLGEYPMIRLTNGIQAPVIQEHARLCRPAKAGQC